MMNKLFPLLSLVLVFSVGCGGGETSKAASGGSGSGSGGNTGSGGNSGSGSNPGSGEGAYSILYPYAVETGRISYKVSADQQARSSSGTSSIKTSGVETLIFSNWGNTRRMETTTHTDATFTIDGNTTHVSFDDHKLSKVINKLHYFVDFDKKEIKVMDFTDFVSPLNIISNHVLENGEGTIYETSGTEFYSSYECNNLNIIKNVNVAVKAGDSVCEYKRVNLRTTIDRIVTVGDIVGTNKLEVVANNVAFNTVIGIDDMSLPDFPVINGAQLIREPHIASQIFMIDINAVPAGCSDGAGTLVVNKDIINGTVRLDSTGQSFDVSGQIGPDKKIHGGFIRNSNRVADYNGTLSNGELSGAWEDYKGCYGSWSNR
jgi:hypothetical protein